MAETAHLAPAVEPPGADGADRPLDRPVDRVVGGYLLIAAVALLFPDRPPEWPWLGIVHLLLAAVLLGGGLDRLRVRLSSPRSRWSDAGRILLAWYPLLLMPFLYWELPLLNSAVWGGRYFDGMVMGWEEALFASQPSTTLALRLPSLVLSEVLHLAYLAYYPILYFFPAWLFATGRHDAFAETVFAFMVGFTATYVFFIFFPVQGPRYLFPAPGGPPAEGRLYALTHTILEGGSSQGAAFPSAHAALAVIAAAQALRHAARLAPLLGTAALGICVGAVYGGFHYAVDMVAGAGIGVLVAALAPALRRRLA